MHVICATAARVLQTLVRGIIGKEVRGVTSLDNLLYVLRRGTSSCHIEVYDKDSYCLQRKLTVRELGAADDIATCKHERCAYVSDSGNACVHRVALPAGADVSSWPVNDKPVGISVVTDSHSVLVTCWLVGKIKEFSTDGQPIRELQLSGDVPSPQHTIQLSSGQFMVCHGLPSDKFHRVGLLASDGQIVTSFGGSLGSGRQQMNVPRHLAVDKDGFVFVVDLNNRRVLLLSASLTYIREVVSRDQLKGKPYRLCLDEEKNRLYVAYNNFVNGGQVVVMSI